MKIFKWLLNVNEYCFYRIAKVFGNKGNGDAFKGMLIIAVSNGLYLIISYLSILEFKYGDNSRDFEFIYTELVSVAFTIFMLIVYFLLFNGKYLQYKEKWQDEPTKVKFINGWLVTLYLTLPLIYLFVAK